MKGLRCTTENCEHNYCNRCMAGVIDVSEMAVCKTKLKREGGSLEQLFKEYEAAPSIDSFEEPEVVVQCNADCVYNNNHLCNRENLDIEDGMFKTKCFSRRRNE